MRITRYKRMIWRTWIARVHRSYSYYIVVELIGLRKLPGKQYLSNADNQVDSEKKTECNSAPGYELRRGALIVLR